MHRPGHPPRTSTRRYVHNAPVPGVRPAGLDAARAESCAGHGPAVLSAVSPIGRRHCSAVAHGRRQRQAARGRAAGACGPRLPRIRASTAGCCAAAGAAAPGSGTSATPVGCWR
jgi:hypothetical protein